MKKQITLCIVMLILSVLFIPPASAGDGWSKGGLYTEKAISQRNLSEQYYVFILDEGFNKFRASVYSVPTGEKLFRFYIDDISNVRKSVTSASGSLLCVMNDKGNLAVYDYLDGKILNEFPGVSNGDGAKVDFAISDNNKKIILLDKEQMLIKVWDIASGDELQSFYLDKNPANVELLSLSPKGDLFYFLSGGNLEIWSVDNEEFVKTIPFDYNLKYNTSIYCDTDCSNLIFINDKNNIKILNIETEGIISEFSIEKHLPNRVVVSPNGKFLISIENGTQSYIWDVENDSLINRLTVEKINVGQDPLPLYISNNGEFISLLQYVGAYCGKYAEMPIIAPMLVLYDRIEDKQLVSIPDGFVGTETPEILLSPDGSRLLARGDKEGEYYQKIYIWDTENEDVLYRLEDMPEILSFTPNGNQLLYSVENKLMFFDLESQSVTDSIVTNLGKIFSIEFSPSNELLIFRDAVQTAIYEFDSRKIVSSFSGTIYGFTRDEDYGYIYNSDFEFSFIQISTGDVVKTKSFSHEAGVELLDVSEFGEYYLAGNLKNFVVINVESGDTIYSLELGWAELRIADFTIDHKHIYIHEVDNPIEQNVDNYGINLETGEKCDLPDGNLFFSSDREHYAFADCPGVYGYRAFCGGFVSVEGDGGIISDNKLSVFPNPVSDEAEVVFELDRPGVVEINLVNNLGINERTLLRSNFTEGRHRINFSAGGMASGMYYIVLKSNGKVISLPLVILN